MTIFLGSSSVQIKLIVTRLHAVCRSRRELSKKSLEILDTIFEEKPITGWGKKCLLRKRQRFLSISHWKDELIVFCVSAYPVGVDIELVDERLSRVLGKITSAGELEWWRQHELAPAMLWTAKESVYKIIGARGAGLWSGKNIVIVPSKEGFVWCSPGITMAGSGKWLSIYYHDRTFIVSVAVALPVLFGGRTDGIKAGGL